MNPRCGIDTSILVRLVSGLPQPEFEATLATLTRLVEVEHVALFASNMVIGEAYMAVQHHYAVSKGDARRALRDALTSGLVAPLGGEPVLAALAARQGSGLLDRLIALEYGAQALTTVTLDRKMAALPGVTRLAAQRSP
jgi:predicted nucleic acid-binding protein